MDELFGTQIKEIDILYKICRRIYKILLTDDRLSSYSLNFLQPLK